MASPEAVQTPIGVDEQGLVEKTANLQVSQANGPEETPAHRSHNPDRNQKRSDPFQFGSRFLNEGDDVFEFNAWDHVETDDAYKKFAEQQYEMQRQSPVSDFDKSKFYSTIAPAICLHPTGVMMIQPYIRIVQLNLCDENFCFSLSLPSDHTFKRSYFVTFWPACFWYSALTRFFRQIE